MSGVNGIYEWVEPHPVSGRSEVGFVRGSGGVKDHVVCRGLDKSPDSTCVFSCKMGKEGHWGLREARGASP